MQNEVNWLSKIQHQNIIRLLGYCVHGEARFLVYDMVQNGSLDTQLCGTNFLSVSSFADDKRHLQMLITTYHLFYTHFD